MKQSNEHRPHPLDALIWSPETWVSEFNALLDAIELQFAVECELGEEIDALGGADFFEEL